MSSLLKPTKQSTRALDVQSNGDESDTPRIAIIGAGLGGLALANILQNRGVPCIIYELEDSAEARVQGGSLDMGKFGLHALEQAGLMKQFISIARPEGDALFIAGKDGKVHIAQPPPDADQSTKPAEKSPPEAGEGPFPEGVRPEVDRGMLRQLLLDNLKQGTIKWGHKLQSITHATDRSPVHELIFGNGVTISADLVVGADGAWSHVRPLVSSARPEYTGVSMVEVRVDRVDELHPSIAKMVGPGAFLAFDTNKGLMAQRNATSVRTYATLRVPEDWAKTCGIPFETNPGEAKQKLLEYYEGWAPELRKLIEVCNDSVIPRGIYRLPIEMKWEHTPGVTLLGDSAHLMSPFAGEGANLAMYDGAVLAGKIADALSLATDNSTRETLESAIASYEQEMFVLSKQIAQASDDNLKAMISERGLQGAIEYIETAMKGE